MPQNQARWDSALSSQKILFVSGKGGVGKSLIAAGIARQQVHAGRRVLLVEIGDNSYFRDFFGLERLDYQPQATEMGFDLAMWSGETSLKDYVLFYLKIERVFRLFFENKIMRALINVAPGLNEISILGKITSGVRKIGPPLPYDLIVVDCYATGHALTLFQAPRGMLEAIGIGPMATQSREIEAVLRDPETCGYAVVTLLEEMPMTETLEFRDELRQLLGVEPAVIANKVMPTPVANHELEALTAADPGGMGEFAKYLSAVESRQKQYLEVLSREFKGVGQVPLVFSNDPIELIEAVGEALRQA
jgi:anion-transporting  ArsA/GET3 family ATPase